MIGLKSVLSLALICILLQHNVHAANNDEPATTTTAKTTTSTTTKPTTTTIKTTTQVPSTTTTAAPPKDKKFPDNIGSWRVQDKSSSLNVTCIIFKGAMELSVNYTSTASNVSQIGKVDIPETATSTGECIGSLDQYITLKWSVELKNKTEVENQVTISFHKEQLTSDNKNYNYAIKDISATVYKDEKSFPKAVDETPLTKTLGLKDLKYMTPMTNSYSCKSENELESENNSTLSVKFANLQLEAFGTKPAVNVTEFSHEVICSQDASIVSFSAGVIFGIVLLVLILIGLVGGGLYLFKRRRATTGRAYENM